MSKRQGDEVLDGGGRGSHPGPLPKEAKLEAAVDKDLEHVYETLDISPKSQRLLTKQHVKDISTLMNKASKLKNGELPGINTVTQNQLHKFCQWYHAARRRCSDVSGGGEDFNLQEQFDENSLTKLENDQFRAALDNHANDSEGQLEGDLELVCNELDMPRSTRQQLASLGITNLKALLGKKTDLELFALANIKKTTQKALLKTCLWHEDFYRKHDDDTPWQTHFNDESFAKFEQEPSVERDYRVALERIHEGRCDGGISNVSEEMISYAATITTRYLSKQLVDQCRNKFSPFDVAVKCHKALMHPRGDPDETIHLISGRTQSGKSTVKAVCAAVHRQLSCLLIIITKGIAERDDLKIKLNKLLGGCRETMEFGMLVVADTGGQIEKAIKAVKEIRKDLPHARFGVIVDECDAMYRTKDCAQITEQRYAALMDLRPSFRMEISATTYSALQALDEQGKKVEMMEICTTADYSGIYQMKHMQDENGKEIFLNAKDFGPTEGVEFTSGGPEPTNLITPLLFSDTYELNRKCIKCKERNGCEMHTDIVSKRSWDTSSQSIIPYTSQAIMTMLEQLLPHQLAVRVEEGIKENNTENHQSQLDGSDHGVAEGATLTTTNGTTGSIKDTDVIASSQMRANSAKNEGSENECSKITGQENAATIAPAAKANTEKALDDKEAVETKSPQGVVHKDLQEKRLSAESSDVNMEVAVAADTPLPATTMHNDQAAAESSESMGEFMETEEDVKKMPARNKPSSAPVSNENLVAAKVDNNEQVVAEDSAPALEVDVPGNGNEKVTGLTRAEVAEIPQHKEQSTEKGLLALIATNPRVYANGNVITQAACVQNHFRNHGKDFVAVVATGLGVFFRFPNCKEARFIRRSLKTISEIIEQIDKAVGLETPIVIFGYSRMCRCVSFRSANRVPTHLVLSRGPGYSLEDYIQAIGRATFNGLQVLKQNGHNHVTILTNEDDFHAAKKYYSFVQAINSKISNSPGISQVEALRCASEKLPDEANFFRHTNRKVGRRKDLKGNPGQNAFEEPSSLDDLHNKRDRYWKDTIAQRVMKVFLEMASDQDDDFSCYTDEIVNIYDDIYPSKEEDSNCPSTRVMIKKALVMLEKDVIFEKTRKGDEKELQWSAKSMVVLKSMINDELEELDESDVVD